MGVASDIVPALPTALDEAAVGQRCARHDDRHDEDAWPRQLPWLPELPLPGRHRHHLLHPGGLLRFAMAVRKTRHTVTCCLVADLAGVIAAIAMAYLFFPFPRAGA